MKKNYKLFLNKTILVLITVLIVASVSYSVSAFLEDFSTSTLDPAWNVVETVPGFGSYSLTDNPGYLRYYLTGSRAYSGGWANDYKPSSYWQPSLTLLRQFDGENWVLRTKVDYNLHANIGGSSTGAQRQAFWIALGEDKNDYIYIHRSVDWWYGHESYLETDLVINGVTVASFTGERTPVESDGWTRGTYWYEITKKGNEITVRFTKDNYSTATTAFSASLSEPFTTQRVIIDMNVWDSVGSYVDLDYINVESIVLDADSDGYTSEVDCDDNNPNSHPGATEVCNNIDDDCDGTIDEELTQPTTNQNGLCSDNTETCSAGVWTANAGNYQPVAEICDNLDNDCDGVIDEELTRSTNGLGECSINTETCSVGVWIANNEYAPVTDNNCDGLDQDCNGVNDNDYAPTQTNCGIGECAATGTLECISGLEVNSCAPGMPTEEVCDGKDNDCDSATDEGYPNADGDGMANCVDPDDDNDGVLDFKDLCPLEDARGFDANNDGCIDSVTGLLKTINILPNNLLSAEIKNSLLSKADNAMKSVDRGNDEAAINMLGAFVNQVKAQRGKKISGEAADMLIAYANNAIAQIKAG